MWVVPSSIFHDVLDTCPTCVAFNIVGVHIWPSKEDDHIAWRSAWVSIPHSTFLLTQTLGGSRDGSCNRVLTSHVRNWDEVPCFWLQRGPVPAIAGVWGMKEHLGHLSQKLNILDWFLKMHFYDLSWPLVPLPLHHSLLWVSAHQTHSLKPNLDQLSQDQPDLKKTVVRDLCGITIPTCNN